jgi:hypothetical protein
MSRDESAVHRPEENIVPGELFVYEGMQLLVQRFNILPQK